MVKECQRSARASDGYCSNRSIQLDIEGRAASIDTKSPKKVEPTIIYNALPTARGNLSYREEVDAINARVGELLDGF